MKALLDTHTWLWMAADPDRLSAPVRTLVAERATTLWLSAASGWELALLWKLGRVGLPDHPSRFVPETCAKLDVAILPIHLDVAVAAVTLPLHHRDPFDRILVATALRESMTLLSCDERLDVYGVRRLWV